MHKLRLVFILGLCCVFFPTRVSGSGRGALAYRSAYLKVGYSQDQPALTALAVDSLGKDKLDVNVLLNPDQASRAFSVRRTGQTVKYWPEGEARSNPPAWIFTTSARQIRFRSSNDPRKPATPIVLNFDLRLSHPTLLGRMNEDGSIRLPTLLHLPGYGTFRITTGAPGELNLGYEVLHYPAPREKEKFVRVTFPGTSQSKGPMDYVLEVVSIYPRGLGLDKDPRFDGFRRNFINIFQLSPRFRVLANNAGSDACAITVYQYGEVALQTPPLAQDLTALDLVRETLDRYLHGFKGCGMTGYNAGTKNETGYDFMDAYPSLIIAAADYVQGSQDKHWLCQNYSGLQAWARRMLDFDSDGDGLLEYPQTRESGPWPWNHPANWWDAIWFTHKDAFSNELAYKALLGMAQIAGMAEKPEDQRLYVERAEKLRSVFAATFYNPATGVLAGWKDKKGILHDYYLTFVNSMAISLGLVSDDLSNRIMDRLLAEIKVVGYDRLDMGVPGNLIAIRKEDYNSVGIEWGGPEKEDGSDAFQNYENGGASACYMKFFIEALYRLGRSKEGDRFLFPLLQAFEERQFDRRGPDGRSTDWRRWDGTPKGYEGFLADNYLAVLAALARK